MKIDRLLHYFICLLLDLSLGYLVIFLFLLHKEDMTSINKQVKTIGPILKKITH
jgi:hypothetical protein